MPTTPESGQRYSGCLIGQCVGDALGFIVEGHSSEVCHRYVEERLRPRSLDGLARGPFPLGQYSDDSQLARELMQSYVANERFDPADYARRIAAIFEEQRIVGRGRSTEEAAQRLSRGVHWEEAGTPPPTAGNGSAMRAAPVGLFHPEDPSTLIETAHDQGRITHQDERCVAGSVAVAGMVALAIQGQSVPAEASCTLVSEWVQPFDPILSGAIGRLPTLITQEASSVAHEISRTGLPQDFDDGWSGISPFVTTSVLWSLYSFLKYPDDYWDAICCAISIGGDVDTTAAMTGAMSGAHLGIGAIPADVAGFVNDRGTWRLDELMELAKSCCKIVSRM